MKVFGIILNYGLFYVHEFSENLDINVCLMIGMWFFFKV